MKTKGGEAERGSQAVHRLLKVLCSWNEMEPTLTLTEVMQRTGLTLPTTHRMIKALQREGFLVHDRVTGRYSLGPTIMDLARVILQRGEPDELVVVAMPHLERMRAITGETVGLHLAMNDQRICFAELVSREPIRTATGIGRIFELPEGAAGRVLVAWSPERLEMVLAQASERAQGAKEANPRLTRERLMRSSAQVRRQGYAISEGETIPGASAIAFPVFSAQGDVRTCINVTGPANRWTKARMVEHLEELNDEVLQIEAQLGFQRQQSAV